MKVTLDKRYRSVSIKHDFPFIGFDFTAEDAYALLLALDAQRGSIRDLALNYYDCSQCGETHAKGTTCPQLSKKGE